MDKFNRANQLTPSYVLTLFIVSVLAAVWAIMTVLRRKSRDESSLFVAFIDLCFVGAFIAGVYELRSIAGATCSNFAVNTDFGISLGYNNGVSLTNGGLFTGNIDKSCAMLKASFAFGIMNCIFFFFTSFLLLFMHRDRKRVVVEKREVYRRRSHDSRRGHSRSGSQRRRSHDSRRYDRPYV